MDKKTVIPAMNAIGDIARGNEIELVRVEVTHNIKLVVEDNRMQCLRVPSTSE